MCQKLSHGSSQTDHSFLVFSLQEEHCHFNSVLVLNQFGPYKSKFMTSFVFSSIYRVLTLPSIITDINHIIMVVGFNPLKRERLLSK